MSERDEISSFDDFKKILYPATSKCFLVFNMLDGLILFRKGDFRRIRSF